jgi:hypothetical protein
VQVLEDSTERLVVRFKGKNPLVAMSWMASAWMLGMGALVVAIAIYLYDEVQTRRELTCQRVAGTSGSCTLIDEHPFGGSRVKLAMSDVAAVAVKGECRRKLLMRPGEPDRWLDPMEAHGCAARRADAEKMTAFFKDPAQIGLERTFAGSLDVRLPGLIVAVLLIGVVALWPARVKVTVDLRRREVIWQTVDFVELPRRRVFPLDGSKLRVQPVRSGKGREFWVMIDFTKHQVNGKDHLWELLVGRYTDEELARWNATLSKHNPKV